jgi:hypothetical protein
MLACALPLCSPSSPLPSPPSPSAARHVWLHLHAARPHDAH